MKKPKEKKVEKSKKMQVEKRKEKEDVARRRWKMTPRGTEDRRRQKKRARTEQETYGSGGA